MPGASNFDVSSGDRPQTWGFRRFLDLLEGHLEHIVGLDIVQVRTPPRDVHWVDAYEDVGSPEVEDFTPEIHGRSNFEEDSCAPFIGEMPSTGDPSIPGHS